MGTRMRNWFTNGRMPNSPIKNYLAETELSLLNRSVTTYLEMAEIQAMNRIPLTMRDWSDRLCQFLTIPERDLLTVPPMLFVKDMQ